MELYSFVKILLVDIITVLSVCIPFFVMILRGIKCLLRSEMLQIYYHNKDKVVVRQYELENFIQLYKAYKALKGNSFIDKIYKEVMTWEVIT